MKTRIAGAGVILAGALVVPPALAQDNRMPLNYRALHVSVREVQGNQNRNLNRAKVTIEPEEAKAHDPFVNFPIVKTVNTRPVNSGKIPPTSTIGTYKITVVNQKCDPRWSRPARATG